MNFTKVCKIDDYDEPEIATSNLKPRSFAVENLRILARRNADHPSNSIAQPSPKLAIARAISGFQDVAWHAQPAQSTR
jgi:hypothetical protein